MAQKILNCWDTIVRLGLRWSGFFPPSWVNRKKIDDHALPYLWCRGHIFFFLSVARWWFQPTKKNPTAACGVCLTHWKKLRFQSTLHVFWKKETRHHLNLKKKWVRARGFLEKPHYLNPRPRFCFFSIKLCISVKDNFKKLTRLERKKNTLETEFCEEIPFQFIWTTHLRPTKKKRVFFTNNSAYLYKIVDVKMFLTSSNRCAWSIGPAPSMTLVTLSGSVSLMGSDCLISTSATVSPVSAGQCCRCFCRWSAHLKILFGQTGHR